MNFELSLAGNASLWLQNYAGYVWILVALCFLFAELNTPGLFFFISFAVGSLGAAVLAFLGYTLVTQCVVGLLVAIVSFVLLRNILKKKNLSEIRRESAVSNIDALVGSKGVVLRTIPAHEKGLIKIGGESWSALSKDSVEFAKGEFVRVVEVKGNSVIVTAFDRE